MPETNLSYKELSVLAYIQKYRSERGYSPSIREICKATGFRSSSLVRWYIGKLEKAGKITMVYRTARSIVVLEPSQ